MNAKVTRASDDLAEALDAQAAALSEPPVAWNDRQKKRCGALVSIGYEGDLDVTRGLIAPADMKTAKTEDGNGESEDADTPRAQPLLGTPARSTRSSVALQDSAPALTHSLLNREIGAALSRRPRAGVGVSQKGALRRTASVSQYGQGYRPASVAHSDVAGRTTGEPQTRS
jgi:hypothetical protein